MHEFDKFIINKIIPKYTKILPTTKDVNPLYSAYSSPIRSVRSRIAREKAKEGKTVYYHPNQPRFDASRIQILENEEKILIQLRENAKIPYNTFGSDSFSKATQTVSFKVQQKYKGGEHGT